MAKPELETSAVFFSHTTRPRPLPPPPPPLNKFKSPDLDKSHPRLLKELPELLSIIFEKAWRIGELLTDKRGTKLSNSQKRGKGHIIKTISQSA